MCDTDARLSNPLLTPAPFPPSPPPSAVLGFVAAVVAEASSHHTVWSQVAGKIENLEMVEKPLGSSALLFAAIVTLVTMSTLMPKMLANEDPDSGRSFGPFTPALVGVCAALALLLPPPFSPCVAMQGCAAQPSLHFAPPPPPPSSPAILRLAGQTRLKAILMCYPSPTSTTTFLTRPSPSPLHLCLRRSRPSAASRSWASLAS